MEEVLQLEKALIDRTKSCRWWRIRIWI